MRNNLIRTTGEGKALGRKMAGSKYVKWRMREEDRRKDREQTAALFVFYHLSTSQNFAPNDFHFTNLNPSRLPPSPHQFTSDGR